MTQATEPEYDLTVDRWGAHLRWKGETFQIEETDLIDGGWHQDTDCKPCEREHLDEIVVGDPEEVLKRWHDAESRHSGAFKFCSEQPCQALRDALEDWPS